MPSRNLTDVTLVSRMPFRDLTDVSLVSEDEDEDEESW